MPTEVGQTRTSTFSLGAMLRYQSDIRRRLRPLCLTLHQAGILQFLQQHPGAKRKETAHALGSTPPSTAITINALLRKKWIIKARPTSNYRVVALHLTPRGEKVAQAIADRLRDMPNVGAWA